jgi:hypothetical protein
VRGERGACGDYTDLARLRYAYTTHLRADGKALLPPAAGGMDMSASGHGAGGDGVPLPPPPRLPGPTYSMMYDAAAAADGEAVGPLVQPAMSSVSVAASEASMATASTSITTATAGGQPLAVKIRVPSYTDRIW